MSDPTGGNILGVWDAARRDRRLRAWMVVNALAALAVLDDERGLPGVRLPDVEVFSRAFHGYVEADGRAADLMNGIRSALGDPLPPGVARLAPIVGAAWAAAGLDPADLARRCDAIEALVPLDDGDAAVGAYLSRHGLPDDTIAALLAAWPRADDA